MGLGKEPSLWSEEQGGGLASLVSAQGRPGRHESLPTEEWGSPGDLTTAHSACPSPSGHQPDGLTIRAKQKARVGR